MNSVNAILKSKKLTIYRVIQDIESIESNCQRKADIAYPNFDYPEHTNYMENFIKKEVKEYKRRKNIDRGKYFRIVADVFVNDKSLAEELIKRGLAVPYDGGTKESNWCED